LIAASLVFLTPRGALLALCGLVPLAALALAAQRERRARTLLRLPPPARHKRFGPALAVVVIAGLLGLAASQPVLRSTTSVKVRTDTAAIFVIDISRSMLASKAPEARTRIARARDDAVKLRDALSDIPAGVATMTNRVLPDLLPIADRTAFEQTVHQAVRIDEPPPSNDSVTSTSLGALGALGTQSFFGAAVTHRVAIVLTDGESKPFDVHQTARALAHAPGVTPIFVHVWSPGEAVFDANGHREAAYHPDAASAQSLAGLAQAADGKAFRDGNLGAVASAVRAAVGRGPTESAGLTVSTTALAPYAALAALVPLLVLVAGGLLLLYARKVFTKLGISSRPERQAAVPREGATVSGT
jgi:hypothetical protein